MMDENAFYIKQYRKTYTQTLGVNMPKVTARRLSSGLSHTDAHSGSHTVWGIFRQQIVLVL